MTDNNTHITFCIATFNKTPWLKKCVSSILNYCETDFSVKVLSQGPPDSQLRDFLNELDERFDLITSPVNLGLARARKLLTQLVRTPLMMTLDDDVYLTKGSMPAAVKVLQENSNIGAVSMPQYDPSGYLITLGGLRMTIRDGVIFSQPPVLDSSSLIIVEALGGGATLFRTEMRNSFSWDENYRCAEFEDLDKNLQILRAGRWKQAITLNGKLIHDRSWAGTIPDYERTRFDGLTIRRNYRYFRRKWGLRVNMRTHLIIEVIYPALALSHFPLTVAQFDALTRPGSLLRGLTRVAQKHLD